MQYYLVLQREETLTYATTWMNLEDIMLIGISPSQKDIHMIPLTDHSMIQADHGDRN